MAISILTSVIVNLILTHFHRRRAVGRQESAGSQVRGNFEHKQWQDKTKKVA